MIIQRDALGKVVCNIRSPLTAGGEEIGTGVFIARGNDPYILTASHVVSKLAPSSYFIVSDAAGRPVKVPVGDFIPAANGFRSHPVADLAIAKLSITQSNASLLAGRCFPFDQIDTSSNLVSKDVEMTTIGFPMGLGVSGPSFSPLTFRTYVSAPLITLPRFDNKIPCDFTILEMPSIGGYSGGPVFDLGYMISGLMTQAKEKTIMHGLVHGTISDPTGGKLAAITPLKYLIPWL